MSRRRLRLQRAAEQLFLHDRFSLFAAVSKTDTDGLTETGYPAVATKADCPCLICSAEGLFNLSTKNKVMTANRPGFEQFRVFCLPAAGAKIGDYVAAVKAPDTEAEHRYTGVVQKAAYYETHTELLVTNERLI